jgi:hypothetical protein
MLSFAARCRATESEMETTPQELTLREQAYVEHARQAKAQGLTLKDYCQNLGVNVRSLYGARRDMVKKGLLPRTRGSKNATAPERSQFVAVRVATPASNGSDAVCRVRHPSGWIIECGRWPEAAWVLELTQGADHAAA